MTLLRKIIHLESCDSTNNYAATLISEGNISHGTVILADEQTSGRGQRGAEWASNSGENLLMSLVLYPDNLSVTEQFVLSEMTALSIVSFLRKIGLSAQIKWPNDILVQNQKIAGVLIENQLKGDSVISTIIGIGLNINQQLFDNIPATSIRNLQGKKMLINEVVFSLMDSFEKELEMYRKDGRSKLDQRYLDQLYGYKQLVQLEGRDGRFNGIIEGVKQNGKLIVRIEDELRDYDLKELRFILQNEF